MTQETIIEKYAEMGLTLTFGVSERNGLPTAKCTKPSKGFAGIKHIMNFYFKNEEARMNYVIKFYEIEANAHRVKEENKKKRKENNAAIKADEHFKVGDIIVNTWGYEQTNVEFYVVTAVIKKSIKVIEVSQKDEEGSHYSHGMACNVIPNVENKIGEEFMLRLKADHNNEIIISQPKSYSYFHKWNGKPKYKSWYN